MTEKGKLIFMFDNPPKVSKGAFNWISQNWEGEVIYVCMRDFEEYRKKANWNDSDYGKAIVIFYSHFTREYIDSLVLDEKNIFIFSSFLNDIARLYLDIVLKKSDNVFVFSERPTIYGSFFEKALRSIKWSIQGRNVCELYQNRIKAFLPLGVKGLMEYKKFGWKEEKMYSFMYNPITNYDGCKKRKKRNICRFVYVGRFSYKTKGVDILMRAIDQIKTVDYTLTMVGGYGEKCKSILKWINSKKNVFFDGIWDSLEVSKKLKDYDVIIIPSRFDGWNLLINEAINAGIGIICSDQTVSDELVLFGRCGYVFKANSVKALYHTIEKVLNNQAIIDEWEKNAVCFQKKVSSESVGRYLFNILNYEVNHIGNKPQCPWLC